ncbi:hypothetical protein AB0M43_38420 [Longispora sp. NPDC051575]|uniref:hypothetical protein n=1 Tax=Longispora sp. NPDC051575 TaxID=3154943 RepID=UPI00342279C1
MMNPPDDLARTEHEPAAFAWVLRRLRRNGRRGFAEVSLWLLASSFVLVLVVVVIARMTR